LNVEMPSPLAMLARPRPTRVGEPAASSAFCSVRLALDQLRSPTSFQSASFSSLFQPMARMSSLRLLKVVSATGLTLLTVPLVTSLSPLTTVVCAPLQLAPAHTDMSAITVRRASVWSNLE
jgi:hypothetical protein